MALLIKEAILKTYLIAASIMCLKMVAQAWVTVFWMLKEKGGYLHPEDLKKTLINANPNPDQLKPNPNTERSRAMQRNDTENIPIFLVIGFLFTMTNPELWLTQTLLYGYVVTRLLHTWALGTAQLHDVRATFWTLGSMILIIMSVYTLLFALG